MTVESPTMWRTVALGEVAKIERSGIAPDSIESGTTYVGLENIASGGAFVDVGSVQNGQLASTKFVFTAEHVLYGKLRPYLAKIACPDFGGVCSTDILPILPGPNLDRRYLCYFLRQPHMVDYATSRCTGANLPRLSPAKLAEFDIPLPPLPVQKRIADILDKADSIRRKRQDSIQAFESLSAAVFNEMFAERLPNIGWSDLQTFISELRYGTSNKAGQLGYTTLRIPNIIRGTIDLSDLKTVEVTEREFDKLRLVEGDVLFVRTNGNPDYVGRCAVFDPESFEEADLHSEEIIYASYLIRARLKLDRIRPVFLQSFLQTPMGRRNVRDKCRTSAGQYNINTKGIGTLQIPEIDIDEQMEFESRLTSLRPVQDRLATLQDESDDLFNSLVQRAFKGEL